MQIPRNPYLQLFHIPGTSRFFIAGLIARFPQAMMTLGIVLMLNDTRASFTLPSLVASTCILSCALIAPQLSRLADRYGQTRVAILAIGIALAAYCLLITASLRTWPDWVLFAGAAGIGCMPNFGAFSRARWSNLYGGSALLRPAFALESLCEEMVWMSGPVIVVWCATRWFPEAGVMAAAGLFILGAGWFCTQTRTEPAPRARHVQQGKIPAIFNPVVLLPALALFAFGGFFGVLEVATAAFAKQLQMPEKTFYPLSSYAIGSLLTGTLYGLMHWTLPLKRQLLLVATGFVVTSIPFFFIESIWILTLTAFITGATCSPFIIIALALVERLADKNRLTESMTWALVSPTIGMSAGFALTGALVDRFGPVSAFHATIAFSLLACVIVLLAQTRLSPSPEPVSSPVRNKETNPSRPQP